ncbi:MAG: hypothetical protein CVU41_04805 [Chloroflexi bacterium HGW-Chloroflexi-3]|nr:MAG: hypothetical protein CVU41_04805 [Chloroflexi bacterium HGW-Chloroflexi-3]
MHLQKRTLIAFLILLIFLALQISVNYPNPRLVREIKIKNETSNQYLLILGLPEQIWFGQSEKIIIQLLNDNYQNEVIIEQQEQSDFDSRKIQNFEVDFVLTGAELTPPGVFITPIIDGKDIIMNWGIEPTTVQDVIGTVWIYINTFSDVNEEENQRELIFTKNLSIKIKNFFGLKIGTIQLVISLFIVLNIIYLFRSYHLKKKGLLGVFRRAFARLKTPCP